MSAMSPLSNLETRRSSSSGISFGGRSLVRAICFPRLTSSLNVWKSSSCTSPCPLRKWTSSRRSTSRVRYFSRNSGIFPAACASRISFANASTLRNRTFAPPLFCAM